MDQGSETKMKESFTNQKEIYSKEQVRIIGHSSYRNLSDVITRSIHLHNYLTIVLHDACNNNMNLILYHPPLFFLITVVVGFVRTFNRYTNVISLFF